MTKTFICYALIYIVWGSTYFFIKLAVWTIPPEFVVGSRFLVGGIFLGCIAASKGYLKQMPSRKELLSALCIGFLLLFFGNGLVSIAQKKVDSYIAALVIAATPIPVLFYDTVIFRKRLSWTSVAGALIGIIGVALLMSDGSMRLPQFSFSTILLLVAICFWGLGTSLSKVLPMPKNSVVSSSIQQLGVGVVAMTGALLFTPTKGFDVHTVASISIWAVLYLSIMGSITLAAYSYLLSHEPNARVVTYAFVNPVLATIIGIAIGNEYRAPLLVQAILCILAGLFLMFYGKRLFQPDAGRADG